MLRRSENARTHLDNFDAFNRHPYRISCSKMMPVGRLILGQLVVKAIVAILDTPYLYVMKMKIFNTKEYQVFERGVKNG